MFKNFLKGLKDVCDDLMDSNVGEELKKAGRELKAQLLQEDESSGATQTTSGESSTSTINATTATVSRPANTETAAVLETSDDECADPFQAYDGGPSVVYPCVFI